jgi:hypothetical protein
MTMIMSIEHKKIQMGILIERHSKSCPYNIIIGNNIIVNLSSLGNLGLYFVLFKRPGSELLAR